MDFSAGKITLVGIAGVGGGLLAFVSNSPHSPPKAPGCGKTMNFSVGTAGGT